MQLCAVSQNEYAHGATQMSPNSLVASEVSPGTTAGVMILTSNNLMSFSSVLLTFSFC